MSSRMSPTDVWRAQLDGLDPAPPLNPLLTLGVQA
jgi:hypothetical protein